MLDTLVWILVWIVVTAVWIEEIFMSKQYKEVLDHA